MHRFFAGLISVVPAILLSQIASAADLPVKARPPAVAPAPVFSWTGCYVGVNAGGHWSSVSDPAVITDNTWFSWRADITNAAAAFPNTLDPSGFAGGGQLGCNWQISNLVIGAEGDIVGLTGSASRNTSFPLIGGAGGTSFVSDSAKDEWMSTVRGEGRVGL